MADNITDGKYNLETSYNFRVYLDSKEVCRIHLTETLFDKQGVLEVIDRDNMPPELKIGTGETEQLISFLKGRVLPSNRMFLDKHLSKHGIVTGSWISMLILNRGMVYEDNYHIEVEQEGILKTAPFKDNKTTDEKTIIDNPDTIGKFSKLEVLE